MHDAAIAEGIRRKFRSLDSVMDERLRRQWAAAEARALSRGGISAVVAANNKQRSFAYVFVLIFLGFYLTVPLVGTIHMLPRYYVLIIPLMFVIVADSVKSMFGQKAMMMVLCASLLFSLANHGGRIYPRVPGNNGAIAERSAEYSDLLKAQCDIMR